MELLSRLPPMPLRLVKLHLASSLLSRPLRRYASTANPSEDKKKAYSHTLLLPKTTFPLKVKNPVEVEKRYRNRTADELYRKQWRDNPGDIFVLHDGPPYANGNLHMGHALNRILKDIINRYQVIRGKRVHYVPGWDCHGLPIEMKALAEIGTSHMDLDPQEVRSVARKTATEAIEIQKREMRDLGVMADWDAEDGVYITMEHGYEVRQLRLFQKMVEKGYISHRLRPVYYSPSTRTALAESELSYQDGHKSRSVYVTFDVNINEMSPALREAYEGILKSGGNRAPLPGNSGVAVGMAMSYCLVEFKSDILIIAEDRIKPMEEVLHTDLPILKTLSGADLVGTRYSHLFCPPSNENLPSILASKHVTSTSGTGLVHSAPAHGQEDYQSFLESGILPEKLRCPINDAGEFTSEVVGWAGDESFQCLVGKEVLGDGSSEMIRILRDKNVLLAEEAIEHRYPYDWKSKKPIIIRATPQWFADVESIKSTVMKATDDIKFFPPQSRNRLEAFVASRSEWCISRQRSWGLPIPAIYDSQGKPIIDDTTLSHIISVLETKGTDHWWSGPIADFVPPHLAESNETYTRGRDTLDVWFDSGSSWTLLEEAQLRSQDQPLADVYLEGSDQHRGWFQSSILTRVAVTERPVAPYKNLITHGFIMDEEGQKMSKSAGNGLSPLDIVHGTECKAGLGADTLRLWAASTDYLRDVSIGPSSIRNAGESLRKLRSTLRFLLANTAGSEVVELKSQQLSLLDRYVLHEFAKLEQSVVEAYDTFSFNKVLNGLSTFASSTLSTLYFEVTKDSLYCGSSSEPQRVAIVATMSHILRRMTKMLAPITPHLSEEINDHMRKDGCSVFLDTFTPDASYLDVSIADRIAPLLDIRSKIAVMVEQCRANKSIKSSSEVEVWINGPSNSLDESIATVIDLRALCGVARVSFGPIPDASSKLEVEDGDAKGLITIKLARSSEHQCPRCWNHTSRVQDMLCKRCDKVTSEIPVAE